MRARLARLPWTTISVWLDILFSGLLVVVALYYFTQGKFIESMLCIIVAATIGAANRINVLVRELRELNESFIRLADIETKRMESDIVARRTVTPIARSTPWDA